MLNDLQERWCRESRWDFSDLRALFLNCTLKRTPELSHTEGVIAIARTIMERNGVATELLRPVDSDVAAGVQPDMTEHGWETDEWPAIQEKVMAADILVLGTPIWLGEKSSVCTRTIERLYANSAILNEHGQYAYYGRVGGCLVTGNEVFAVMAIFTKETAITLPFMVVMYEACFFRAKTNAPWRKPIILLGLITFALWATALLHKAPSPFALYHNMQRESGISAWHYLLTQFNVIITYIRLLIFPVSQNVDYDYAIAGSLLYGHTLASLSLIIIILLAAFRMFSGYRLAAFGIFWFFLTLLPESSVIPLKDVIFEHRLYLPMAGFSIFLVSAAYYLIGKKNIKIMVIMLLLISAWYSFLTYNRNLVWKNELTLWKDAALKSPSKARVFYNLGNAYADSGNTEKAEKAFLRAYQLKPDIENANNLAANYADSGQIDKAIYIWESIVRQQPGFATAHFNLATFYFQRKQYDLAIMHCDKVVELGYQVDHEFLELLKPYRK